MSFTPLAEPGPVRSAFLRAARRTLRMDLGLCADRAGTYATLILDRGLAETDASRPARAAASGLHDAALDVAANVLAPSDDAEPALLTHEHRVGWARSVVEAYLNAVEGLTWRCPCGEDDLAKRYGGPADHEFDPKSPCEACVAAAFAEAG